MKNYCLGFVFNQERTKVALIKKIRPEWQKGFLNGIGGKIEPNETVIESMVREFKEETGLEIHQSRWRYRASLSSKVFNVAVFTATANIDQCRTMEDEEVIIVDVDKIKFYPVINNLHWLIPLCLDTGDYHVVESRDKPA